jgi:hypothetical protein
VDQRLDLKAVAPKPPAAVRSEWRYSVQAQDGKVPPPEDVEPIAKIGIVSAITDIKNGC